MFKESVQVVKEKDPAIKSTIEVLLYPSFWAVINHLSLIHISEPTRPY